MKYLKSFNKQLRFFCDAYKLSSADIAEICGLDESVVAAWESSSNRVYPSFENLLDLCIKTGVSLESFLDLPNQKAFPQLELPGFAQSQEKGDLSEELDELDKCIEEALPNEQELELLRRFRKSDDQNRELILQLMADVN